MPIITLNKQTADALCTLVTIGFMDEQSEITDQDRKTRFEGENPTDKEHTIVRRLIHTYTGIDLEFTHTVPAEFQPYIFAKPAPGKQISHATIFNSYQSTQNFWESMEEDASTTQPCGAYIGGYLEAGGFHLTGPSQLFTYLPLYRAVEKESEKEPEEENIYKDYGMIAAEVMNAANSVERALQAHPQHINYTRTPLPEPMKENHLFGCVHGMIHAMTTHQQLNNEEVHIEYSLGPGTTKVASCLPCSLFMSGNGTPASSTHLGRGDFWNLPDNIGYEQKKNWQRKIAECFVRGRIVLGETMENNIQLQPFIHLENHRLWEKHFEEKLSRFFLESLTFPDKFTTRIINTLQ